MTPDLDAMSPGRLFPRRHNLIALGRLALPVVVVQVGLMAMGVADTVMVGHVSPADLAAVALGNLYFFTVILFGMGVIMALDPVVAQAVGARDEVAVSRGVQRGLVLALGLAVFASLLLTPGEPVFTVLRQPDDVVPLAAHYAWASIPGTLPFLVFVVLRQTLQALERMAPIVWTIVAANLANLFLNWVFIFGNLGMPAMGAVGSGWASSIARAFMAMLLLAMAWPVLAPYLRPWRPEALQPAPLARMLRLGVPIGVQFQLEVGVFAVVALMMGWMGTVTMAGHQVAINLASFTFMVPLGISQAAAVLVGQSVGRSDSDGARRFAGAGLIMGGGFMTLTAAAFLLLPGVLAGFYTTDGAVLAVAIILIPVAGIFQVFDGLQIVAAGVLRGAGDTRAPMVVNLLGFWLVGVPVSVYLGFFTEAGPVGLWWGLVVGLGVVAILLLSLVQVRLGGEIRRVVIDGDHAAATVPTSEDPSSPGESVPAAGGRETCDAEPEQGDPWIESPEGSLFFLNALLVTPAAVVLLPLALGVALRGLGILQGPSTLLDPIPAIAAAALPYLGWLLVIPLWTTIRNLRIARRPWPRAALGLFLLVHSSFLTYAILRWSKVLGG